jgi:hypothetical protein
MTTQAPDPQQALDQAFVSRLLDRLADALPTAEGEPIEARDARQTEARIAFDAIRPRDAMEAMLAVEAILTHYAIIDCLRQSMLPGTDPAVASRLRNNATAMARVRGATLRTLDRREAAPAIPTRNAVAPGDAGRPTRVTARAPAMPPADEALSQPPGPDAAPETWDKDDPWRQRRAELAGRIPLWKSQDMTMDERRIAYGNTHDLTPEQIAALAKPASPVDT